MDKKVKLFECYDFNDEVYLIETVIDDSSDNIDWGEFTVPEKNAPESDWQVAYAEQYLNPDGTERICDLYDKPEEPVKPCRAAFFIYKTDTQEKKITTPYGTFGMENVEPVPERLLNCIEFESDEDD